MADVAHGSLTPSAASGIHVAQRWTVADAAARAALVVTSADVGGIAYQTDSKELWFLADTAPTWQLLGVPTARMGQASRWYARPNRSTGTLTQIGMSTANSAGTTAPSPGGSSTIGGAPGQLAQQVRTYCATTAVAGNRSFYYWANFMDLRGAFDAAIQYGVHASSPAMRWAAGFQQDPNVTQNMVTDYSTQMDDQLRMTTVDSSPNVHLMWGRVGFAPTLVDLGAAFPSRTAGAHYVLSIAARGEPPTSIRYKVVRLDTALGVPPIIASGVIASNINFAGFGLVCGCNNVIDAQSVALAFVQAEGTTWRDY